MLAIIPALIYRAYLAIIEKPLWLICEDGNTARDNGYYFYKYMRENHPEVNCKYVIRKQSNDYEKIEKLGIKPIRTSSFKHYVLYLAAKWNISNHKHGNPNQPFFYIVHVILNLVNNRVFLQHGITKDDSPWIYYKNTKFKYFICGAKREYDYIKEKFGYPKESVVLTGFPRFDTLIDKAKDKKQILIMPTWRNWLGRETNPLGKKEKFEKTEYFKNWNGLLTDKRFINYIEKEAIEVLFYPHQHMQKYLSSFEIKSKNIKIASMKQDIQLALRESYLMITDYSSVYMDFAYMHKPVIYFQFDYDKYRSNHLEPGYFDYIKDGFGPITTNTDQIIEKLSNLERISAKYSKRCMDFFNNKNNVSCCGNIYELLTGAK